MFIQVIEGTTKHPEAVHRQVDIWQRALKPDATGYLGSTGGCASNGDCILIARFESREAAMRNSDRQMQTRWWRETERCFDGPVQFHDSTVVQVMSHGELDDAGFVQVMEGHVTDRHRAMELLHDADPILSAVRPDLLGSVTAYFDGDEFTEVAYFSSEDAAREAERKEIPSEAADIFAEWQEVMKIERYLDLSSPWLMHA